MSEGIRFHLDENVDTTIAHALRREGIDVTTTTDARLRTQRDEAQFAFAQQEGRVLVTHDTDFLKIAHRTAHHAGVAYCAPGARTVGQIAELLTIMHAILSPAEMADSVQYL
ncbi:MAG: DUF5615 family PIN-like protein [Thermomicrobiales bacterium]